MTRSRGPIAVLLVLALLATLGMQTAARRYRERLVPRPHSASRLAGLDSFALGLVLGGLRGPLVMALWSDTENQKNRRELEDIDTKIELIRKLQPEFTSVHLFQIWNKAYNLSAQMASLPNKYATILDALDYARSVDSERPDDINIVFAIADIYFNKLGESNERRYYTRQLRRDTLPHAEPKHRGAEWRRLRHEALLDEKGLLLPALLAPQSRLAGGSEYDGSELQFLKRYNTLEAGGFPYGLSPAALGYNYFRRAAALGRVTGQQHLQMSHDVINGRPAVALRSWAEEEWTRAREREIEAFGKAVPEQRPDMEAVTAGMPPDAAFVDRSPATRGRIDEAAFSYRRAAQVAAHAEEEYLRHVGKLANILNAGVFAAHIDTVRAVAAITQADHAYLQLLASANGFTPLPAGQGERLRNAARQQYQEAINRYYLLILRYYTDDEVADVVYPAVSEKLLGRRIDKTTLHEVAPAIYPRLHQAVREHLQSSRRFDPNAVDVDEYEKNIQRCQQRLQLLQH